MSWNVWLCASHTGDLRKLLFSYSNRGHAVAKLRGLMRHARSSELVYAIRKG